ncbi:MAG: GTPase Era [Clostridia bacterium]|nr:GTPase Era [Clostridia bacterium]MBQ6837793.1 GTPase Era [Clostridia bacterium]
MSERKTAFIAIVGRPNVGKSSILNNLLGQKVAIVSSKPQTTRTKIMGVLTEGDVQLVFTDTPGFHKPKTKLGEKMIKAVDDSIGGVDSCLFVTESKGEIREAELDLLKKLKSERIPVVLAINKIDMLSDKQDLMTRIVELTKLFDFEAVVPVCARDGDGMDELKEELFKLAAESEFFFPEDTLTDQPERVLAAEMIREKLLHKLSDEIPHGIAVSIERMREREDKPIIDIEATIYCERESHKGIVIGKKGAMLKEVSTNARHELEQFFDCKVNLQCWVKVKEDWRNREGLIHNFGLD